MNIAEAWAMGGWGNFLAAGVGFVALLLSVPALALALGRRGFGLAAAGGLAAMMTFAAGALGEWQGLQSARAAVSAVSVAPSQKAAIMSVASIEAHQVTLFGMLFGGLPALLSIAALVLAVRKRDDGERNASPTAAYVVAAVVGISLLAAVGLWLAAPPEPCGRGGGSCPPHDEAAWAIVDMQHQLSAVEARFGLDDSDKEQWCLGVIEQQHPAGSASRAVDGFGPVADTCSQAMLDYIVKAQRGQAHGIAGPERRTPLQLLELLESSQIVSGDEHARRLATLRTQLKR